MSRQEIEALIHDDMNFGNLAVLPSRLNSSKQDKLYSWSEYKEAKLDAQYVADLAEQRRSIVGAMQAWVTKTVKGR